MSGESVRTYRVSKTRQAKPRVRLYINGVPTVDVPCKTATAAVKLGLAWEESA